MKCPVALRRRSYLVAAVSLAVLAFAPRSHAASVTANATIDLSQAITGTQWTGFAHPLDAPVQVSNGDTVTINIQFPGTQALTWNSSDFFQPWLMLTGFENDNGTPVDNTDPNQRGQFGWSNLSVALTDLTQGTQLPAAQLADGGSGALHLGPSSTLGDDDVTRTFTGATLSFLATWNDGDPFRSYSTIGYHFRYLFNGSVSFTGDVPEPASLGLLALVPLAMLRLRPNR